MSDKSKKTIDAKPIKDLAKILDDLNLTKISYSDGDFSVSVSKAAVAQAIVPAQIQTKNNQEDIEEELTVFEKRLAIDYQLQRAIDLIRGVSFYKETIQ